MGSWMPKNLPGFGFNIPNPLAGQNIPGATKPDYWQAGQDMDADYSSGFTPEPGAGGNQPWGVGSKYLNQGTGQWGTVSEMADVPTYTYPEQFGPNAGQMGVRTAPKPGMVWTGVGWEEDPLFSGPQGAELTQLPGGSWGWVSYEQPAASGVASTVPGSTPEADFTYDQGQDWYEKYGDWFTQPTTAGQAYGEIDWGEEPFISTYGKGKLGELDRPTNLERMLPGFEAQMPDLATDPGLGPYYEDAKRRAQESIDNWAASRGAYGSSAALTLGADEMARLEGERALNEAQYALDRSAEQRGWISDIGDIGGQADIERGRRWEAQTGFAGDISDQEFEQDMGQMAMALGVDGAQLSKMVAGMAAATGAETLSNAEKMQMLQSIWGPMQYLMGLASSTYGDVAGGAEGASDSQISMEMNRIISELGLDERQADIFREGMNTFLSAYSTFKPNEPSTQIIYNR